MPAEDTRTADLRAACGANPRRLVCMLTLAVVFLVSASRRTDGAQIVVLGDSWASRIGTPLSAVADQAGVTVANEGIGGLTAVGMAADPDYIEQALAANPDAAVVHLSIGGNDLLDFTPAISERSAAEQETLLESVRSSVQTIVDRITAARPSVEVLHVSYDFLRPLPGQGTPEEVNAAFLRQAAVLESEIVSNRYTYLNNYGAGQIAIGIPELSLPPGDPSLPRIDQPGPAEMFDDPIHLTPNAYFAYAELVFDQYRGSLSVPEPTAAILFLIAAGLGVAILGRHLSAQRRKRIY